MARALRYSDKYKLDKRRRFIRKVLFILGIILAFAIALIYLLFFSRLVDVRGLNINNNIDSTLKQSVTDSINDWLNDKSYFIQRRRSIFFVNISELEQELHQKYSKIDSIVISRNLFHDIDINIKERLPSGIWCAGQVQQCFYFNKDGIIYENSPQTLGFLILIINDEREKDIKLGDQVIDGDWQQKIFDTSSKLISRGFKVKNFVIPKDSIDEFYALTPSNFRIIFSVNTDINAQIDSMYAFMNQKLTPDRISKLEYIDLTIQDRIYYK